MAAPAGFEPATYPLGGDCSIQLSHGAVPFCRAFIENTQGPGVRCAISNSARENYGAPDYIIP